MSHPSDPKADPPARLASLGLLFFAAFGGSALAHGDCSQIASAVERLDCYDRAHEAVEHGAGALPTIEEARQRLIRLASSEYRAEENTPAVWLDVFECVLVTRYVQVGYPNAVVFERLDMRDVEVEKTKAIADNMFVTVSRGSAISNAAFAVAASGVDGSTYRLPGADPGHDGVTTIDGVRPYLPSVQGFAWGVPPKVAREENLNLLAGHPQDADEIVAAFHDLARACQQ